MDEIIGRQAEKSALEDIYYSEQAEFIAVYGRRRVGKTFLIKNFFKKHSCVYLHITGIQDGLLKEQLYEFTRILEVVFFDNSMPIKEPESWTKAFFVLTQLLNKVPTNKKLVLFFDELPWLAGKKSKFLQALDYYWNRYWVDIDRLKLIVCGSAASWIIDNIINNKGGLHNRVTKLIYLEAFTLSETKEYLHYKKIRYNNQQILELYMSIGGIPHYLNHLQRGISVAQNIDNLCFFNKSLLCEEFKNLYRSLFSNHTVHEELIRIISSYHYGISRKELINKTKLSAGGRITKILKELEHAGFIYSFIPYGNKSRDIYYKTIDEYTLFYLKWIEPLLNTINKQKSAHGIWEKIHNSPKYNAWAGLAFEIVCFKHINKIQQVLKIPPTTMISSWSFIPSAKSSEQGAQIDLLFDRDDGIINICEIKYTKKPYSIDKNYASNLLKKIEVFKAKNNIDKQTSLSFILSSKLKKSIYSEDLIDCTVTSEKFF